MLLSTTDDVIGWLCDPAVKWGKPFGLKPAAQKLMAERQSHFLKAKAFGLGERDCFVLPHSVNPSAGLLAMTIFS
jgi:hypothetical protein